MLAEPLGVLGEELREDVLVALLVELEGIGQADAVVWLVGFGMLLIVEDALDVHIRHIVGQEHDLVANDLLTVPFEEFFEFFNQKALDKLMVFCYCL